MTVSSPAIDTATELREPFLAFVADAQTRASMARVAGEAGWSEKEVLEGGPREAVRVLAGIPTPRLLVVDLSDCADPVAELRALAEVCDGDTRLVALGTVNDGDLFRRLIASGIDDYLVKPVAAETLAEAVAKANRETAGADAGSPPGRLIAVTGARGGVGASTVAVNCAWQMAHIQGLRVVLVDLDLHFGTTALALNVEPGRGFREALENPERMDGLFIERAMVREGDNLFILAAEESLETPLVLEAESVERLVEKLRRSFECVVVDLPRLAAARDFVWRSADSLVVVTDLTLAGMRDTLRLANHVAAVAPRAEVRLVANRVGALGKGEIARSDFERATERGVDYLVPFDAGAAVAGAGLGKPMVQAARRSKAATSLRRLARDVSGRPPEHKAPLWRRLLMGKG